MANVDTLSFGGMFKRITDAEGLSKVDIAKRIGMSDPAVHKILNDANSPSIDRALKVLSEFGYTVAIVPVGSELPEGSVFLRKVKE